MFYFKGGVTIAKYDDTDIFYVVAVEEGSYKGYMYYGSENMGTVKKLSEATHFESKKSARKFEKLCNKKWNASFSVIQVDGKESTKRNIYRD